ncbi:hypothetical protein DWV41_11125 [Bacteroides stercoris]|uniref:Transposase family protein n=1 Tax=Bacteroides stercoris TaxID=46506 RepID=A0A413E0Z5_BACSE|nr:hypothetical protein DWV41_11125 [Bacteroides stercoris]
MNPVAITEVLYKVFVEDFCFFAQKLRVSLKTWGQRGSHLHLHSKGFFPEIEVQDFPIRGKAVYLRVKRRRWEDPETGQYLRLL